MLLKRCSVLFGPRHFPIALLACSSWLLPTAASTINCGNRFEFGRVTLKESSEFARIVVVYRVGSIRKISVPSFSTNRRVPSGSVTSVAGQRSGGKLASIALMYCGEHPLQHAFAAPSRSVPS